jgi:hypothetical protein
MLQAIDQKINDREGKSKHAAERSYEIQVFQIIKLKIDIILITQVDIQVQEADDEENDPPVLAEDNDDD